jgi:hypothetical protein
MTEPIRVPRSERKLVGPGRPRGIAAIRKRKMIEDIATLIAEGHTQQEIAERLGITQSSVSKWYRQALEFYPYKDVDQRRELMLLQLDAMAEKAQEIIDADHPYVSEGRTVFPIVKWDNGKPVYGDKPLQDAKVPLQAINTFVGVLKRVADTIGSDAPKRLETASIHVKAEDLRVVQLVGGLKNVNSERAGEIKSRVEARRSLPPGSTIAIDSPVRTGAYSGRPYGATERRSRGHGADPRRVSSWHPESLYE